MHYQRKTLLINNILLSFCFCSVLAGSDCPERVSVVYLHIGGVMNRKLSSFLMVAGTVFTVLFCLVYMARDFTKVINFSNMSDMWSLFVFNDTTGHALFSEVNIDDFVSPPLPRSWRLPSYRGRTACKPEQLLQSFRNRYAPGTDVRDRVSP